MIWKTRDADKYNNAVYWNAASRYKYLAVIDARKTADSWMGLNEKGFAILNSFAYDLLAGSTGLGNGALMTYALANCQTVSEFRQLLDSTNATGRRTAANFAVMDSTGAAAIFETSGRNYWEFDAVDSVICPDGYQLRTNFTVTGGRE
jgi:penicillin V acylase-like amidase (Ntn superfamily)